MSHQMEVPAGWSLITLGGQSILVPINFEFVRPLPDAALSQIQGQLARKAHEARGLLAQLEVLRDRARRLAGRSEEPEESAPECVDAEEAFDLTRRDNEGPGDEALDEPDIPDNLDRFHPSLDIASVWAGKLDPCQRDALIVVLESPEIWSDHVQVLSPEVRHALRDGGSTLVPDSKQDDNVRLQRVVERLKARDRFPGLAGWRRVARASSELDVALAGLASEFLNLAEVVEFLRDGLALAARRDGCVAFEAVLLKGPPGVGKTEFVSRLAELFGVPWIFIDMAAVQSGACLGGSDEFWSNSKPGRLFETVVEGACASPAVILDELDKVGGDQRFDPLGPLYRLLEPASARRFSDAAIPRITFDASRIFWFATANQIEHLPRPLLSRFRVFEIPAPTVKQARGIARRLYDRMVADVREAPAIDEPVIDAIAQHSVREFKRLLESALARAVREGSGSLSLAHLALTPAGERRAGFV